MFVVIGYLWSFLTALEIINNVFLNLPTQLYGLYKGPKKGPVYFTLVYLLISMVQEPTEHVM